MVVSWCSKKQSILALSSTEVEYIAATMAAQECIWIKCLMGDTFGKVDCTMKIQCDNGSANNLGSNPIFHGGRKHIEVCHHFIREEVFNQEIELKGVHTSAQVADIFAKALEKPDFGKFRVSLGTIDSKYALRGSVKN